MLYLFRVICFDQVFLPLLVCLFCFCFCSAYFFLWKKKSCKWNPALGCWGSLRFAVPTIEVGQARDNTGICLEHQRGRHSVKANPSPLQGGILHMCPVCWDLRPIYVALLYLCRAAKIVCVVWIPSYVLRGDCSQDIDCYLSSTEGKQKKADWDSHYRGAEGMMGKVSRE